MKKINETYLNNLVSKLLNETLEEKADHLVSKIKGEVGEGELAGEHPEFGDMNFGKMSDEDIDRMMRKHLKSGYDKDESESHDDEDEFEFEEMDENYMNEKEVCDECGGMMNEGECSECGYKMESIYHRDENELPPVMDMDEDIYDVDKKGFPKKQSFDYVEEEMKEESEKEMENKETCDYHLKKFGPDDKVFKELGCKVPGDVKENLIGKQRRLDKNKNGKIDAEDFAMLRKSKKKSGETDEQWQGVVADMAVAAAPAVATWALDKAFGGENNEGMKKMKKKGFPDLSGDGKVTRKDILLGRGVKLKEGKKQVEEKWKGDVEVEKSGEYGDMSIEEINAAIKKLKSKNDKTKEAGKKVSHADRTKMSQLYFAKRAKQGWKGKGSAKVSESVKLTENELINMIEKIVKEQKAGMKTIGKPKGLTKYEQVHKADGKENQEYLKMVTKKMKDYLKDGSKGDYEMNPKHFPKGNGELGEMKKKAYKASDAVKDYVDNFTAAGQENLMFDEIHPSEERMTKHIEGSSETGNNPKWANAVETPVNKKRNQIRKDNLLGAVKKQAYNKAPQPIVSDEEGEATIGGKMSMNVGKGSGKKANKILSQLESVEPKEEKKLNEEFDRMKNLITYNRKTQ